MNRTHVTNNHFREAFTNVGNFTKHGTYPPEDLLFEFIYELKVSNLILPLRESDDGVLFEQVISDGGRNLMPAFTDDDEFLKYTTKMEPAAREITYFAQILAQHKKLEGLIINIESDGFFISRELILKIHKSEEVSEGKGKYSPQELRQMAETISNDSLVAFINDRTNVANDYGLIDELEKATFLNLIKSEESLDDYVKDGIISSEDVGGFDLVVETISNEKYALLFTDKDSLKATLDRNAGNYYLQVTDLKKFIDFVLTNDIHAIIINPGKDDYFVTRKALFVIVDNADLDNPELAGSNEYAFPI